MMFTLQLCTSRPLKQVLEEPACTAAAEAIACAAMVTTWESDVHVMPDIEVVSDILSGSDCESSPALVSNLCANGCGHGQAVLHVETSSHKTYI